MAGISPSSLQPQPYAGYNPSYAPSGYMPGAPAGFIMNPFVSIPPKVTAPPPPTTPVPKPVPGVPNSVGPNELGSWDGNVYTESSSEDQGSSFSGLGYENDQRAVPADTGPEESTSNYVFPWQMAEATRAYSNALAQAAEQEQWTGEPTTPTALAPKSITEALPNINYKDLGSVALSLALGNPLGIAYTAADKFLFNDALPGPLDALNAVGKVVGSVGGALGGLFGLNKPSVPTTTWDSYSTGSFPLTVEPLPPPPFTAIEQYDGYGTSYEEPYTGWQDPTDYGYQTDELTWSPGEDVASWSEDLAQAAEAEQWGG